MKRFTGTEIAGLILAAVLFFGGASLVIWPQRSGIVIHEISSPYVGGGASFERMGVAKSRLWGAVAMAFGGGLAVITIYRGNA